MAQKTQNVQRPSALRTNGFRSSKSPMAHLRSLWTWGSDRSKAHAQPSRFGQRVGESSDERAHAASCGPKPVWINEAGFATTPGRSERQQADWWVRAVATFLATPRVEHVGIYEVKDLSLDTPVIGDAPNYHLGITRADRTPKLAFYTLQRLVQLLATDSITVLDASLEARVTGGRAEGLRRHLFVRPDGIQVAFVWVAGGAPTVSLRVPTPGSGVVAFALDGRAHPWPARAGPPRRLPPATPRPTPAHPPTSSS